MEIKEKIKEFTETSGLSRDALLRLIEKWRHLQSGASDKKTPGYSATEG
jgi:hypothetical protein